MRGCVLVVIKESLLKLCEVFLWAYFYTVKRKVKWKCKTKEDKNRTCFSWLEVVSLCCPPPHFPSNQYFYRFLVSFTSKMTLKGYPSVSEIESKISFSNDLIVKVCKMFNLFGKCVIFSLIFYKLGLIDIWNYLLIRVLSFVVTWNNPRKLPKIHSKVTWIYIF